MRAESEIPSHRWWHRYLSRAMGLWREQGQNQETGLVAVITRTVFYCPLCRIDFHEGAPLRHHIDLAIGKPPTLTAVQRESSVPPENIVKLPFKKDELQAWPPQEET